MATVPQETKSVSLTPTNPQPHPQECTLASASELTSIFEWEEVKRVPTEEAILVAVPSGTEAAVLCALCFFVGESTGAVDSPTKALSDGDAVLGPTGALSCPTIRLLAVLLYGQQL